MAKDPAKTRTGKVRGLLCTGCNVGLGRLEAPNFFGSAMDYLKKHGSDLNV